LRIAKDFRAFATSDLEDELGLLPSGSRKSKERLGAFFINVIVDLEKYFVTHLANIFISLYITSERKS